MRNIVTFLVICTAVVIPIRSSAAAQSKIPPESLDKLQNVLSDVRDQLWDKSDEFFHAGDYQRCIGILRLIAEIDPTDSEAYSVGAWLMYSTDKKAEGIAFLELGLKRNPKDFESYKNLGDYYFLLEDHKHAAFYYVKALEFPDCPKILLHALAHCYEELGQFQEAVETWERAAALEPNDPVVKNNLERVKKELADRKPVPTGK